MTRYGSAALRFLSICALAGWLLASAWFVTSDHPPLGTADLDTPAGGR